MKNTRTSLNRGVPLHIQQYLFEALKEHGIEEAPAEEMTISIAAKSPGMTKAEVLLLPVNYVEQESEKAQKFPQSEMLRRATLARTLHDAKPDEEIKLSASDVVLLKELMDDYADEWPVSGVNLDIIDIIQEVNELAGTPVTTPSETVSA